MAALPNLPYGFARQHGVLVHAAEADPVEVWLRDDVPLDCLAEVRRELGRPMRLQRVSRGRFEARLAECYGSRDNSAAEVMADAGQDIDLEQLMNELPEVTDLLESQDDAPIIRMINALLMQAVREQASDIHIEPYERHSAVRLRRDGVLREIAQPHRGLHAALVSRIKILASLDIAEKRLPQDGRFSLRLAGRPVDIRVSCLPTTHGERLVLRLLDKGGAQFGLDTLGMAPDTEADFGRLLAQPHGIVLVTGPTGSGKSTTLYAGLKSLDADRLNIVTVEDPVEFDLAGVGQIQVAPRIGLSFASALRAILRQDPDVIMIGEIRDLETAQIAVQASLTGHLVLATLHTNDAASAVTRLIDMGVEPFLLASTLRGVLAHRLVRALCPACRVPGAAGNLPAELAALLPAGTGVRAAAGCEACEHTGYRGRTGLYELIVSDEAFSRLIHDRADEAELRAGARARGARSLRDDGLRHLAAGVTSVEELLRVTRD